MNRGAGDRQEEWLERLRESVKDYREPVPGDAWLKLERDMERKGSKSTPYFRIAGAVAAIAATLLLFFVIPPLSTPEETKNHERIAVVENLENQQDKKMTEPITATAQQKLSASVVIAQATPKAGSKIPVKITSDIGAKNPTNIPVAANTSVAAGHNPDNTQTSVNTATVQTTVTNPKARTTEKETAVPNQHLQKKETLSWDEYLQTADTDEGQNRKLKSNWLALSVGNNGLGRLDTKTVEPRNMLQMDAPNLNRTEPVRDIATSYKLPGNMVLPTTVSALTPEYNHKQPISFGITFGKNFSSRFTLETGLVYSLLNSDIKNLQKDKTVKQTLHYLGIPVRFNWNFVSKRKYTIYTGAGAMIEKCIYGKADNEKLTIKSVQTSLNMAVGAQYKFNQTVGIYFEPGLCYYLGTKEDGSLGTMNSGAVIKSIHSEHPLGFTLQAGFRFTF
ncbi:MAG: outer membrane beta-barrel protein [Bacteroidales bacterium]